jgi:hypothetical protein
MSLYGAMNLGTAMSLCIAMNLHRTPALIQPRCRPLSTILTSPTAEAAEAAAVVEAAAVAAVEAAVEVAAAAAANDDVCRM